MFEPEIILTSDGSHSLYVRELSETYHSIHGAIAESEFVYLKNGYRVLRELKEITVLEIGFGTGLNGLLTALEAERSAILTHYFALEKFPLSADTLNHLNYPDLTGTDGKDIFGKIHAADWENNTRITSYFNLKKVKADALSISWSDFPDFDLVYFDAFGPDKQPEIWDMGLFRSIYRKMKEGSILVTYCAKGSVRRELESAGFIMERLDGPVGKREMLRGIKDR
jgi:tRNA U34 5-methylaminomethyl-2-thiouridine-forming methyltransferase MnmC